MTMLHETSLAAFGSRLCLNFRPRENKVYHSAIGQFFDEPVDLAIGVRIGKETRTLPFTTRYDHFDTTEQELTPTSVTFRGEARLLGVRMVVRFTSPFYPGDEKASVAPFFYIDIRLERMKPKGNRPEILAQNVKGKVFVSIKRPKAKLTVSKRSVGMNYEIRATHRFMKEEYFKLSAKESVKKFVCRDKISSSFDLKGAAFDLAHKPIDVGTLIWAAHIKGPVAATYGEFMPFKYTQFFKNVNEVVAFAKSNRADLMKKSALFDSLILESSLGKSKQDFIAFALQGFMANTWWLLREDGKDWWSVWEGSCHYHSTLDVEYNTSWFYLMFWPELLERQLTQWRRFEKPGHFMSHDMGDSFYLNGQFYRHDMEVEENTNFTLLAFALWRVTGKGRVVRDNYALIKRLVKYIQDADTTGNGFPNIGTANTIDDAAPAVQSSREQIYLGIKCLATCFAGAEMARLMKDKKFEASCEKTVAQIRRTLDEKAWLGDHYAVSMSTDAADAVDFLNLGGEYGEGAKDKGKKDSGELEGWNAYSLYTNNGLLYLLLCGMDAGMNDERIRTDLINAARESMCEYGCFHSSADDGNLWVSQNLWRDCVAAYYGVDMLDNVERYWAFEQFENTQGRGGNFIDTYGWNWLRYYPRGAASLGLLYATAGISIDRVKNEVKIRPVRVPCRVPLPTFADWKKGKIPWITAELNKGRVQVTIENAELLKKMRVK